MKLTCMVIPVSRFWKGRWMWIAISTIILASKPGKNVKMTMIMDGEMTITHFVAKVSPAMVVAMTMTTVSKIN
jgi:hypothetical protein